MLIRVLPASKGGIYSNTGSSSPLVNYLEHEAKEEKQADRSIFFDQKREGIQADEVQERIDGNTKGVQKGKPLFHSLVISPSQDELRHLNDDPDKLKAYTRQVMENYAATFTHKRKEPKQSDDLVWYATIHRSRHYSGLDDAVQTGQAQSRQRKAGEQTHIHVVVSARDRSMSRSLHPDAGSTQFNYKAWLQKNHHDFEQSFSYKSVVTEKQHLERLEKQIARMNRAGLGVDAERVKAVGQASAYSADFWKGMSQIERGVKQGSIFTANQAYDRLGAATEPESKNKQQERVGEKGINLYRSSENSRQASVEKQSILVANDAATSTQQSAKQNGLTLPELSGSAGPSEKAESKKSTGGRDDKPETVDLRPLIGALRFESVPETGQQARDQDEEQRRRLKRRR